MNFLSYFQPHHLRWRYYTRRLRCLNWQNLVVLVRKDLAKPTNSAADCKYATQNAD